MPETALRIRIFGDPALRKRSGRVQKVTSEQRDILGRMVEFMYDAAGIGLAAPQVGINECMIVVDTGSGLYKLINPKIIKRSGSWAIEEGCLSVPGVCLKVKRAKKVRISALDEFAKPVMIDAEDLLACVFQHEIDHLKGKLIVDYASFFERLKIKKNLEELSKRPRDEGLPESKTKSCELQL